MLFHTLATWNKISLKQQLISKKWSTTQYSCVGTTPTSSCDKECKYEDTRHNWTLFAHDISHQQTARSRTTHSIRLPSGSRQYTLLSFPTAPVRSTTFPPSKTYQTHSTKYPHTFKFDLPQLHSPANPPIPHLQDNP
ncbi:hypothetical protein B5807_02940 [Epicoccum nigrum]|uniref:Uncharacterized protein n=1 Tax=Epicoccum nigrum TaxID=105696 RepID=A0A1Y2MB30_EPING|nr:hypothetical protein B5807_02940 [Epicoccum nigrum]